MFKKLNTYLIRETGVSLRTYALIGLVSFLASALVGTAARLLLQEQGQPGADQCTGNAHAAAHQGAYDGRLIGLPRGHLKAQP